MVDIGRIQKFYRIDKIHEETDLNQLESTQLDCKWHRVNIK